MDPDFSALVDVAADIVDAKRRTGMHLYAGLTHGIDPDVAARAGVDVGGVLLGDDFTEYGCRLADEVAATMDSTVTRLLAAARVAEAGTTSKPRPPVTSGGDVGKMSVAFRAAVSAFEAALKGPVESYLLGGEPYILLRATGGGSVEAMSFELGGGLKTKRDAGPGEMTAEMMLTVAMDAVESAAYTSDAAGVFMSPPRESADEVDAEYRDLLAATGRRRGDPGEPAGVGDAATDAAVAAILAEGLLQSGGGPSTEWPGPDPVPDNLPGDPGGSPVPAPDVSGDDGGVPASHPADGGASDPAADLPDTASDAADPPTP